jgi:hypothetical protein
VYPSADLPVDVDDTTINLLERGNFNPEFVKLVSGPSPLPSHRTSFSQNPNATVPILTHDRISFTSTVEVINYLVSISQKKIAPETSITSVVHEAGIDPNFYIGRRGETSYTHVLLSTRLLYRNRTPVLAK